MSPAISVPEIGVRIAQRAWRGKRGSSLSSESFVGYVCDEANRQVLLTEPQADQPSGEAAHRHAEEVLSRFWSPDRPCTAIVTNISMRDDGPPEYLVRPPAEGAVTAGYGTPSGAPAFRCILQKGFFLAIRFEFQRFDHGPGPGDLVLAGPFYLQIPPAPGHPLVPTRPPRTLPPALLEAINGLESKRREVAGRVSEWRRFLAWQTQWIRDRQLALRYEAAEFDRDAGRLRLAVVAPAEAVGRFRKRRSFPAQLMPLAASRDPQRWEPDAGIRGTSLGEISWQEARRKGFPKPLPTEDGKLVRGVVDVRFDSQALDRNQTTIPESGFLTSAVHGQLVPLRRQRQALGKLVTGEHINPRLADFLFEAGEARSPDGVVTVPPEGDSSAGLNEAQRRAVAKALAAPDLCLIQGPPGTGKTTVIAAICHEAVRQGQQVLVASQANLAVDNILRGLDKDPACRPVRIANGGADGEDFYEPRAVFHWLSTVRAAASKRHAEGEALAQGQAQMDRTWPTLETLAGQVEELDRKEAAAEKQRRECERRSDATTDRLGELDQQIATIRRGHHAVAMALPRLSEGAPASDLGEWVQRIDPDNRPALFAPLAEGWPARASLPEDLRRLLPSSEEPGTDPEASSPGWARRLVARLRRWLTRREPEPAEPNPPTTPNWAVMWIEANRLFARLRQLEGGLPSLTAACEEAERLCAVAAVSELPESAWAEATRALARALEPLGGPALAQRLGIAPIPTSLRPKGRFRKRLAAARGYLEVGLGHARRTAVALAEPLTTVARTAAEHLDSRLEAMTDRRDALCSELETLRRGEEEAERTLAEVEQDRNRLRERWHAALKSLPATVVERAGEEVAAPGPPALAALGAASEAYREETRPRLQRHQVWGPIQAEWLRLLAAPGETDRQRLHPVYLARCNVVGATCSYCGKPGAVLGREHFDRFDVVIVDEVSKATPPELLLPALLGKKLILVGDLRQLPPTFKEGARRERPFGELAEADEEAVEEVERFREMVTASLFRKLFRAARTMLKQELTDQYRMHPQIMEAINQFYDGRLRCAIADPDARCRHGLTIRTRRGDFLRPDHHILWIDTSRDRRGRPAYERQVGTSKANDLEADGVVRLVRLLNAAASEAEQTGEATDVGVITFYGPQVRSIRRRLDRLPSEETRLLDLDVNTVDSFQGAERSIVIVSLVRSKRGRLGRFARQYERINVAMSRARILLIVLGAAETFARARVDLPDGDHQDRPRKCYRHILDVVRRHGGLRDIRDLF